MLCPCSGNFTLSRKCKHFRWRFLTPKSRYRRPKRYKQRQALKSTANPAHGSMDIYHTSVIPAFRDRERNAATLSASIACFACVCQSRKTVRTLSARAGLRIRVRISGLILGYVDLRVETGARVIVSCGLRCTIRTYFRTQTRFISSTIVVFWSSLFLDVRVHGSTYGVHCLGIRDDLSVGRSNNYVVGLYLCSLSYRKGLRKQVRRPLLDKLVFGFCSEKD